MKPTSVIDISGLRKGFGGKTVLDGIDLSVPACTVFALLGPNGAGKTTLINILSTLTAPDAGTARVAGYDVRSEKNAVKRSISLTGQFAAVDEGLTAEENLRMISRLCGLTKEEAVSRTRELLKQFDLETNAKKLVKTYSGGMRRRLDLAVSLVVERPILFLDEPTTGLDTISRRTLWNAVLDLKRRGVTIFLTTQYLEEAEQLADTIAVLAGGRIVALGTAAELKARVGLERIELRNEEDELIRSVPTDGSIEDIHRTLGELLPTVPPTIRIAITKPSMDDVFISLTATSAQTMTEKEGVSL
ncbi:ABC transporter ATP-binding protein [Gorillibacterium massiliense]|uniref:ABC transporter ATP-binding protein n=1 Tax=Gorillibacterium massiliense TaxID=1280390 RepID=UPI0004B26E80|nr:ATP-binding cassette domain-containing protein [Gorillibacterium massiliense]